MSELKDVITAYRKLPFGDRVVFYSTVSNDVDVREETVQDFLIETRMGENLSCLYCKGDHVVRNGKRKDGTQRFLCRDCGKSFIPGSNTITSGTRKRMSTWVKYLKCMLDKKTLKESSEECGISMPTAFSWRHKILDALREVTDKVAEYVAGFEADEEEMTKYIIGTISSVDAPMTPSIRGRRDMSNYMSELSDEERIKTKKQILTADSESIRSLKDVILEFMDSSKICVLGDGKKIDECCNIFDSVMELKM